MTLGEELGVKPGADICGIMTAGMRRIGFDRVFDTGFTADLTILVDSRVMEPDWIVLGGGNRNRVLNQLTADAVGVPVLTGPSEATAAGNLLAQARLVGILPDAERAAACLEDACPPERFEPRGGWVARLAARFDELKAMPAG